MIEVGYKPAYARSYCGQLWANKRLIAAIRAEDDKNRAKAEFTVLQAELEYEQVRAAAMKQGQLSAAASAITGKARLYGMDKDNQLSTDKPQALTEEQLRAANRAAGVTLADSMKGTA